MTTLKERQATIDYLREWYSDIYDEGGSGQSEGTLAHACYMLVEDQKTIAELRAENERLKQTIMWLTSSSPDPAATDSRDPAPPA